MKSSNPHTAQTSNSWQTRYTFSGKEKDAETGYSYFGARYYDSDLSVWLSVDPMSDKYPSMSAYMYCAGNPVMLVDPDGKEIINFFKKRKDAYDKKRSELVLKRDAASGDANLTKSLNKDIKKLDRRNNRLVKKYNRVETIINEMKKHEDFYNYYNKLTNVAGDEVDIYIGTGKTRGATYLDRANNAVRGFDRANTTYDLGKTTFDGEEVIYPILMSVGGKNSYYLKANRTNSKSPNIHVLATVFGNIETEINNIHIIDNIGVYGGTSDRNSAYLRLAREKNINKANNLIH
ncbi:MAG: hypothetical protein AUJ98_09095 [Bacteroidetes bacterium CG2_30_33_31]|nr:MAG: hypothetical protein AUJ98_09095 [Bacteroidetes bacterium CG2_30_33_31]